MRESNQLVENSQFKVSLSNLIRSMLKKLPRNLPRFSGSFFTWRATLSVDRNKGLQRNLLVFSSGKRAAITKFLWLKFLWNELTRTEFELFLMTLTESKRDEKKWAFLKALSLYPKKVLRKRLIAIEALYGEDISSRDSYLGYLGMSIEIHLEIRRLPAVTKYSGYVRSPSSVGSKRKSSLSDILSEATQTDEIYIEENMNWYDLLSVGSISLFSARNRILFNPEES